MKEIDFIKNVEYNLKKLDLGNISSFDFIKLIKNEIKQKNKRGNK